MFSTGLVPAAGAGCVSSGSVCQVTGVLTVVGLQTAGSRPLIFSQWVVVLNILEWLLQTLRLPYVRLDGNTAVADRLTTVDMCASPFQFGALPENWCCSHLHWQWKAA